ncbi:murein transglycosylase A [Jannaschia pohangensis]|uniref:peptidoglycan lytic exotransglycosylase n=1 Tax=Jannaschia pohangensis TaxID=390807 RepID=A0A1I3TGH7_9RHOB|nr:MltA domain-containing protein [Jannaschia pohangensis]SFJ69549.1 membrane-bound lytic murein transglycosylase A [Jannaschia pohangensis]
MLPSETPLTAPETGRFSFSDLAGWGDDDLDLALTVFRKNPAGPLSGVAAQARDGRSFFEAHFTPSGPINGHFTGYYEPELSGSRVRTPSHPVPLHTMPPGGVSAPRAELDAQLVGQEIAWVRDEVDRFFLQVQGSGRLRLPDGATLRVGYAGSNGHPYRSIGKLLIERGVFGPDITAEALKVWLREDVDRGRAVMAENPSYVFFAERPTAPDAGPMGTLCEVTQGRSIAVDPDHTPLGTPVWIAVDGIARLVIAQDTGSAIKGAGRADLFFGTGKGAGQAAGRLNHPGAFIPLVPR